MSVLVVEDEFYFADDIASFFKSKGVDVVGPSGSLDEAMSLAEQNKRIDGAVLDIRLRDGHVYPLADTLRRRGVPFVFVTAYAADQLPSRFLDVPVVAKPYEIADISAALERRATQLLRHDDGPRTRGGVSIVSIIPEMRMLSSLYAGGHQAGDDLLACTLTEAILLHRQFDGQVPVKLWLAKLLRRQARVEARSGRETRSPQDPDPQGVRALQYSEILLLVCKHGFNFAEAGDIVGLSPSEVELRLRLAIAHIGGRLPW